MLVENMNKTSKMKKVPLPRFYLIDRRVKLGLSVEEVSRQLDVTHYYYYQLENGNRGRKLTVSMLIKLTRALQMDADELLQFESEYIDKYKDLNCNN